MEKGLALQDISKSFGGNQVIDGFSSVFEKGKTTCLLGPSGCGKTTLLRIIAGLLEADEGVRDDFVGQSFSYVFQEDRLLPWKTAAGNIELVLDGKVAPDSLDNIVHQQLDLVQMADYSRFFPHQLSGGMRQRVSFARAFGFPSSVILMDEPFRSLDLPLKKQLMQDVRRLLTNDTRTVIFVTHDPEEAACLGDKITVLGASPAKIMGEIYPDQSNRSESARRKTTEKILRLLEPG
jgi:NitT/TauT family transport system ATP-binding protein